MMSESKDNKDVETNQENVDQEVERNELNDQELEETDSSLSEISLWKDQCKRISAEFENFKKRSQRDQVRWAEISKEKILKDLLTFVDDFERALEQEGYDNSGIEMVYQSLLKLLEKNGVTMMTEYEIFDPLFHEAVMQVESDVHDSGQIVEVLSKGFMIQDRVLRPAKVSVSQ